MFIGHYALGFAAKPLAPSVSLGTLFIAAQFADLLWPLFVLAGLEVVNILPGATEVTPLDFVHYPYSHSLLALLTWGSAFGTAHAWLRRAGRPAAYLLGALVVSHWMLDAISHRPDMPVTMTGAMRVGLGLWNSRLATCLFEGALFVAGVWLYARSTRPRNRRGTFALIGLCAFLVLIYAGNLLGPPPPSVTAIAVTGLSMWLLVAWGYFIDRNRVPVNSGAVRAPDQAPA